MCRIELKAMVQIGFDYINHVDSKGSMYKTLEVLWMIPSIKICKMTHPTPKLAFL